MRICWAYPELLVITPTAVSAIKLGFLLLDVFAFLCNKLNFIVFFSHEKKIEQILENLAREWNTQERNGLAMVATWLKQKESITHDSNFSYLELCFVVPAVRVIQVSLYFSHMTVYSSKGSTQ